MVDIKKDSKFAEFLAFKGVSLSSYDEASDDLKASWAIEMDDWKKEVAIAEARIVAEGKRLYNVGPEELAKIHNVLEDAVKNPYKEKEVERMDFDKADDIVKNKTYGDLSLVDLASLQEVMSTHAGHFDNEEINKDVARVARDKVLEVSKGKHKLTKEEFASFDSLLKNVSYASIKDRNLISDKDWQKAEANLKSAREGLGKPNNEALHSVQKAIGQKVIYFANGELHIDIDYVDGMQEVIDIQKRIDNGKDNKATVDAQNKLNAYVKEYDESNGLTGLTAEDALIIDRNEEITQIIANEDFLELEPFKETPVERMDFDKAKDIVTKKTYASLSLTDLASLQEVMSSHSGHFDNEEVNKDVISVVKDRVLSVSKGKYDLKKEEFASYNVLLGNLSYAYTKNPQLVSVKDLQKATAKLEELRAGVKEEKFTKDPAMQDAYNILNSVVVTGELKLFNRKQIEQKDKDGKFLPDSEIGLFIESVKEQTRRQLLTTKEPITAQSFREAFSENLQFGIVELYNAERIATEKTTKKDFEETFQKLSELGQKGKDIKINTNVFSGFAAAKQKEAESFLKRLGKKVGKSIGLDKTNVKAAEIDGKNKEKFGKDYTNAKKLLRVIGKAAFTSAKWGAAFGVATTIGAPFVTAVAVASLGNQFLNIRKDFKHKKLEAAKNGQKLKVKDYLKAEKWKCAGFALGAVGAVIPGLQAFGGETVTQFLSSMGPTIAHSRLAAGIGVGIGASGKVLGRAIKDPTKENIMGALTSVGALAAGMVAGRATGELIGSYASSNNITQVDASTGAAVSASHHNHHPHEEIVQRHIDQLLNMDDWDKEIFGLPKSSFLYQSLHNQQETTLNLVDGYHNGERFGIPLEIQREVADSLGINDIREPQHAQPTVANEVHKNTVVENNPSANDVKPHNVEPKATVGNVEAPKATIVNNGNSSQEAPETVIAAAAATVVQENPNAEVAVKVDEPVVQQEVKSPEVHTIKDSLGQTIQYYTDKDGLHLIGGDEKITGHSELNNDIAKDVAARAANGNATQSDIDAMQNRTSSEMLAKMQSDYNANKPQEPLLADNDVKNVDVNQQPTEEPKSQVVQENKTPEKLHVNGADVVEKDNGVAVSKGNWKAELIADENGNFKTVGSGSAALSSEMKEALGSAKFENGMFKVGETVSQDPYVAKNSEQMFVNQLNSNNELFNALEAKAENGTSLNEGEKNFMKLHKETLEARGYQRADDGHLQPKGADKTIAFYDKQENTQVSVKGENLAQNEIKLETQPSISTPTSNNNLSYAIDEAGRVHSVSGNSQPEISSEVLAKFTEMRNVANSNATVADKLAFRNLEATISNNQIYNDLANKSESGANLTTGEKNFMAQHDRNLAKMGLSRGDDGNVTVAKENNTTLLASNDKQANNGEAQQQTQQESKTMTRAEKAQARMEAREAAAAARANAGNGESKSSGLSDFRTKSLAAQREAEGTVRMLNQAAGLVKRFNDFTHSK